MQVDAAAPCTIVLRELMYPGWTVTVDNTSADAQTVDHIFRGVHVPAGRHRIAWRYHPVSLAWGAAVSLGSLAVLALVALQWLRVERLRRSLR